MPSWVTAVVEFFAAFLRVWLSETSRDNANKEAGAAVTRQTGAEDALERAKDAKERANVISRDSDAELIERLRRNRESQRGSSDGSGGK